MEVIGFLFISVLNLFFSGFCIRWFLVGCFWTGSILASKEPLEIIECITFCALNVYIWAVIAANWPI